MDCKSNSVAECGMRGNFKSSGSGPCQVILATEPVPNLMGNFMINRFGADRIVVGIDAKDGLVATQGWVETSSTTAIDLAKSLVLQGLRWIIHTDVSTDGAMKGPNLDAQRDMALAVPTCNVIASGGVSCTEDISKLRELCIECPNIEGVIIGKALYENSVDLNALNQA